MRQGTSGGVLIIIVASVTTFAQTRDKPAADIPLTVRQSDDTLAIVRERTGTTTKVPWKSVVGKRVTAQGIAWSDSKGLGDRVILDGTTLYVDARAPFTKTGRLVEVTGILAKRRMSAAPRGSQGFSQAFEYYTLEDSTTKFVESVSLPHVVVADEQVP